MDSVVASVPAITSSPPLVLGDHAYTYFVTKYLPGSRFDYLLPLFQVDQGQDAFAKAAMSSAMAIYATEHGDRSTMRKAQEEYTVAIRNTNVALMSPTEAVKDQTLASILLLSLFETLVHEGRQTSPTNWTAHIEGAAALLFMRRDSQFLSLLGWELFTHAGGNIVVSAQQKRIPVPKSFAKLCRIALQYATTPPLRWRIGFMMLIEELGAIRSQVEHNEGIALDQLSLIQASVEQDRRWSAFFDDMPAPFKYIPAADDDSLPTWIYPHQRIAQVFDIYRMIRIILNNIVHDAVVKIQHATPAVIIEGETVSCAQLLEDSSKHINEAARNIVASVPRYSRAYPNLRHEPLTVPEASTLLWPLAVAAEQKLATQKTRDLAHEKLRFLRDEVGLQRASWATEMLADKSSEEQW